MSRFSHLALAAVFACAFGASTVSITASAAEAHRVAIHVDENDAARMNMALNNAQNIDSYYKAKGEPVQIEIVTYGPGLHMLLADSSPVKARVEQMSLALDNLSFAACGNTHRKMSEKKGKDLALMPEATKVPSGVVRLMELQEQGWSYVRP
jgi:intracellular sulfur oxidation DsrE/DsrF family protein